MNNASFDVKPRAAAAVPSIKNSGSGPLTETDQIKPKLSYGLERDQYDHVQSISIFKRQPESSDSRTGSSKQVQRKKSVSSYYVPHTL
jgi:hypothetical protein